MVHEDNRALEIPAWEKLLACGRGGRGIQCGLIILLLRCLNKRDGAAARIIQLYPSFAMIRPISYRLGSLRLTLLFLGDEGLKTSSALSAGCCRVPDTYGRECHKLILPRSIADTATIWELAGWGWAMPWELLIRYPSG